MWVIVQLSLKALVIAHRAQHLKYNLATLNPILFNFDALGTRPRWVGTPIHQNLHLCPMFTKMNKKLEFLGITADFIYFRGSIAIAALD